MMNSEQGSIIKEQLPMNNEQGSMINDQWT